MIFYFAVYYLLALFSRNPVIFVQLPFSVLSASGGFMKRPSFIKSVFDLLEKKIDSPYLLGFLVDYYEAELECDAKKETLDNALQV